MNNPEHTDIPKDPYFDSGRRGIYFPKKTYIASPLPEFEEIRDRLPSPVLEANPEYLDMYWKSWELAFRGLKSPQSPSPFVSNYVDEAFSNTIFQWDTIFMILFMRYAHHLFPSIASLDNFYCRQYESGYICRQIGEWDGEDYVFKERDDTINPPLFAWAEVENYKITGDASRFEAVIPAIARHAEWLESHMRKPDTRHDLFWNSPLGCGMDNIPLTGSAWVCMSSQMVLLYRNLAYMCKETGQKEKAAGFTDQADVIAARINQHMWHAEDGFYYNLDDEGAPLRVKTVAGFWPMLAGVADHQQARWLLFHLRNAKEFWRPLPFPSVAANEPTYICDGGYWLGGVWAPSNVMIIKGLECYGMETNSRTIFSFDEIATIATERYLDGLSREFKRTGTLWESYSPELVVRGNPAKGEFVGWTGCGPVQLLIENVLGFRPEGAKNSLTWHIQRIDRHGIDNLRFGNVTASLICEKRESVYDDARISIQTDQPFDLIIHVNANQAKAISIAKGASSWAFPSRWSEL